MNENEKPKDFTEWVSQVCDRLNILEKEMAELKVQISNQPRRKKVMLTVGDVEIGEIEVNDELGTRD